MKKLFIFCLLLLLQFPLQSQLYFPPLSGTAWDTIQPQSLGWCQERIDSLYTYLDVKHSKSFIVLKNGKIVLEKYFGTYTADSAFYWASASKSLASLITGMAQEKGYININNQVSQYIGTGWTSEPLAKENLVTVRHLLTMTSGLDDNVPTCDNDDTAKACLVYKADAGTRWGYQTGAYKKVQDVVSAAVGQNYNLIATNWIKNKTGMSGLWIDQTYYSKAREMARYGLLILNRGIWNSDTLIKDTAYFTAMLNTSQIFNLAYGYLWWLNGKASYLTPQLQLVFTGPMIPNAPADMVSALGKNDQKIYIVPSQNLVVIRQGNAAEAPAFALSNFDNNLWDYINKLNCVYAGFPELSSSTAVLVYPNPASGYLVIKTELPLKSASVATLYGQNIALTVKNNTADVSQLAKGSYVLKLVLTSGQCVFKKVMVD